MHQQNQLKQAKNQKNDAPPRLESRGLFGVRFLDARERPSLKRQGFQRSRHKRGQEELVGFVLIVVITVIVFLIFLAFQFNKHGNQQNREDEEVRQFLVSLNHYTTDCAISYEPAYASVLDLSEWCYKGASCTNEESACDVLNNSVSGILNANWIISEGSVIRGYELNISYKTNASQEDILFVQKGSCVGNTRGSEYFTETISSTLLICY